MSLPDRPILRRRSNHKPGFIRWATSLPPDKFFNGSYYEATMPVVPSERCLSLRGNDGHSLFSRPGIKKASFYSHGIYGTN